VGRVEEARRTLGRERCARDPSLDAGHGVPAVLQDLGDVLDLVRLDHRIQRHLGVVVRVERPLVVLLHRLVECVPGHVGIQALELLAELGDVLIGCTLRGRSWVSSAACSSACRRLTAARR
jgi:hypothetical protein